MKIRVFTSTAATAPEADDKRLLVDWSKVPKGIMAKFAKEFKEPLAILGQLSAAKRKEIMTANYKSGFGTKARSWIADNLAGMAASKAARDQFAGLFDQAIKLKLFDPANTTAEVMARFKDANKMDKIAVKVFDAEKLEKLGAQIEASFNKKHGTAYKTRTTTRGAVHMGNAGDMFMNSITLSLAKSTDRRFAGDTWGVRIFIDRTHFYVGYMNSRGFLETKLKKMEWKTQADIKKVVDWIKLGKAPTAK